MSAQKEFEAVITTLKDALDREGVVDTSLDWNYGTVPQNASMGQHKSLARACSVMIRRHISEWIPTTCNLQFCTQCRGLNTVCCYDFSSFAWTDAFNLSQLIQHEFEVHKLKQQYQLVATAALLRNLLGETPRCCVLRLTVNGECSRQIYLNQVSQATVAKNMDISQNDSRISYAPQIVVEIAHDILMTISCADYFVGVGFCDLVNWKSEEASAQNTNTAAEENKQEEKKQAAADDFEDLILHAVLHIPESVKFANKVEISFGVGKNQDASLHSIKIEAVDIDGVWTLWDWNAVAHSHSSVVCETETASDTGHN
mmetsp:Transcript_40073/g.65711  ORF Transcript_40073/g.65711 Transcript_40073/m.65711 type:complete len:314 (-) Transcript_40073:45-986(-)